MANLYPVKGQPGIPKIIIDTLEHDLDQHDPDDGELWTTSKYQEISAYLTNLTPIKSSKIKKLERYEGEEMFWLQMARWRRMHSGSDKCGMKSGEEGTEVEEGSGCMYIEKFRDATGTR